MPTLRERLVTERKSAEAIVSAAVEGERELTVSEKAEVQKHLDEGAKLLRLIDASEGNIDIKAKLAELEAAEEIGGEETGQGNPATGWSPQVASNDERLRTPAPGPIAKAVFKHLARVGSKGLTTTDRVAVTTQVPGVIPLGRLPQPVASLPRLQPLNESGSYSYVVETARTLSAAPVAPHATKPETDVTLVKKVDEAQVVGHVISHVDRSLVMDSNDLRVFLDETLAYGVQVALDNQIINGTGTPPALRGIEATSGVLTQAFATDLLTTTAHALDKIENGGYLPTAWVMHPTDWTSFELIKDTTGQFILGDGAPVSVSPRQLWGVPVVTSVAATAGEAILGDFLGSSILFVREGITVEWSQDASDHFAKNEYQFRGEGRFGFGVTRPAGFVVADLAA